jgi:hypothetical protein
MEISAAQTPNRLPKRIAATNGDLPIKKARSSVYVAEKCPDDLM